jgi:hypothetical protein
VEESLAPSPHTAALLPDLVRNIQGMNFFLSSDAAWNCLYSGIQHPKYSPPPLPVSHLLPFLMVHHLPTPPKSPGHIPSAEFIASPVFEVRHVPIPLFIGLVIMHIRCGEAFHQEAVSSPLTYKCGYFTVAVSCALLCHLYRELAMLSMALWSRPFGVCCARCTRQEHRLTLWLCSPASHFWFLPTWSTQSTMGGGLMCKSPTPFN